MGDQSVHIVNKVDISKFIREIQEQLNTNVNINEDSVDIDDLNNPSTAGINEEDDINSMNVEDSENSVILKREPNEIYDQDLIEEDNKKEFKDDMLVQYNISGNFNKTLLDGLSIKTTINKIGLERVVFVSGDDITESNIKEKLDLYDQENGDRGIEEENEEYNNCKTYYIVENGERSIKGWITVVNLLKGWKQCNLNLISRVPFTGGKKYLIARKNSKSGFFDFHIADCENDVDGSKIMEHGDFYCELALNPDEDNPQPDYSVFVDDKHNIMLKAPYGAVAVKSSTVDKIKNAFCNITNKIFSIFGKKKTNNNRDIEDEIEIKIKKPNINLYNYRNKIRNYNFDE